MKQLVEQCLVWNINDLTRAGVFRIRAGIACSCVWKDATEREILTVNFSLGGSPVAPYLQVNYRQSNSESAAVSYTIELALAACHFGGTKYLFRCPGKGGGVPCGQRIMKLYLVHGRWLCRTCGNLTYLARQKHDSRLDALVHSPPDLLAALRSPDPRKKLLAVRAFAVAQRRLLKACEENPFKG
jgi:hypothetical protein